MGCSEDSISLAKYPGIKKDIDLYIPKDSGLIILSALDVLKSYAPRHYSFVEQNTDSIHPSCEEYDFADLIRRQTHVSRQSIEKGRVYCSLTLVHEATHINCFGHGLEDEVEETLCLEKEADCIEALGDLFWKELNIGFAYSRGAYLGLRELCGRISELK